MKRKNYFALIGLVLMLFCASGCEKTVEVQIFDESTEEIPEETYGKAETEPKTRNYAETEAMIYVYICGAVKRPGVVEVSSGARVFEAIEKAGGMTGEAADYAVNQAALLEDGQQIFVPNREEAAGVIAAGTGEGTEARESGKVNINQAAADELTTLPGIGETRAAGIIEYRESAGGFQDIEEIKNVSGIGDAVFQRIKDKIVI